MVVGAGMAVMVALTFVTPRYTSQARILIDNEETVFTRPVTRTQGGGERMFVWRVTDPTNIVLMDSVVVDARVVNDVRSTTTPRGRSSPARVPAPAETESSYWISPIPPIPRSCPS